MTLLSDLMKNSHFSSTYLERNNESKMNVGPTLAIWWQKVKPEEHSDIIIGGISIRTTVSISQALQLLLILVYERSAID